MKQIFITAFMLFVSVLSFAQNKQADAAKALLKQYKDAVEKLDVTGTEKLFTADSVSFQLKPYKGNCAC